MPRLTIEDAAQIRTKAKKVLDLAASTTSQAERETALGIARDLSAQLVGSGYRGIPVPPPSPLQQPSQPPGQAGPSTPTDTHPKATDAPKGSHTGESDATPATAATPQPAPKGATPRQPPPKRKHTPKAHLPPLSSAPFPLRRWQAEALATLRASLRELTQRPGEEPRRLRPIVYAFMGAGKSIFLAELARLSALKGSKIVVLTPRQKLVRQLGETFSKFIPNTGLYMSGYKQSDAQCVIGCFASAPALQAQLASEGIEVGMLLVDECHGSEGEGIKNAILGMNAKVIVGVTATPFRADEDKALTIFDRVVYRFSFQDGLADRVVVPVEARLWSERYARGLPLGVDPTAPTVDDAIIAMFRVDGLVGPTLTNASSIADAQEYVETLREAGFSADCIHSELPADTQTQRIEDLRTGEIQVLVHVSMLSEGADFPWLRTIALRRKVGSRTRFVQEVGRVLRADPNNPEKVSGIVYDPLAQLHTLGLDHPDAIGAAIDDGEEPPTDTEPKDPRTSPEDREKLRAVTLAQIDAWMLEIIGQLKEKAMISQRNLQYLPKTIRDLVGNVHDSPTSGQWDAIEKWTGSKTRILSYIPCEASREAIKSIIATRNLTRAQAGALLTILGWLAEATQAHRSKVHETRDYRRLFAWDWPKDIRIPTPLPLPTQLAMSAR